MKLRLLALRDFVRRHPRRAALYGVAALIVLTILIQIFYPASRLVPYMKIDGQDVSAWQKKDAAWQLDKRYAEQPVQIFYGSQKQAYQQPKPSAIGLSIKNSQRLDDTKYAWWLRLVPGSLAWAHLVIDAPEPAYERKVNVLDSYVKDKLGDSCDVAPRNANLKVQGLKLEVIESQAGGTCKLEDVRAALIGVKPHLDQPTKLKIAVDEIAAQIQDDEARKTAKDIEARIGEEVPLTVNDKTIGISRQQAFEWLDFNNEAEQIVVIYNIDRARDYFAKNIAPSVDRQPGQTTVTTVDFVETDRQNGPTGATLDLVKTLDSMAGYTNRLSEDKPQVATTEVPARLVYKRSYSPTDAGLSALIKQYAEDNPGKFGISLIELSGKRRRANTNGDQQFVTASTYKLYVAYSTLKRVEEGKFTWSDHIAGGRDLNKCFDDMISVSDNPCAEALVKKIGYRALTDEAKALGAKNTTFVDLESYRTTANDLATFVAALDSGQLLSDPSNNRLLNAMKRNIYRQGIPAGANGTVANKVGFLDDYLHDAGIVYSPSGKYALAVMTQGSSWSKIAEFTKKLEELRSR